MENLELINDLQIGKCITSDLQNNFNLQMIDGDTKSMEKPKRPG